MPSSKHVHQGAKPSKYRSYLVLIVLFAFFSSALLFFSADGIPPLVLPSTSKAIRVVLWDVKGNGEYDTFLGSKVRRGTVSKQCPFNCTITTDRNDLHLADAVVFDPTALDYDHWRRIPISLPHKQPYQQWVMHSYEHQHNYPLTEQPVYKSLMDLHMSYKQDSDIPISLYCPWTDTFDLKSLRKSPAPRTKNILFMSSNCQFSGASARTAYVEELMKYIDIDSYGSCLHNKEGWEGSNKKSTFDHMEEKLELMGQYSIVLAFENHNITDFVTEKLFNAFQAGALPVYMGAPNVDEWLPGANSIVKTDDFNSPKALATYLKKLLANPDEYRRYFEWKKKSLSSKFTEKYERCMYSSECRLCQKIADTMTDEKAMLKHVLAPRRPSNSWQAIKFNGKTDHVKVRHHKKLCVTDKYTMMAWIKPESFGDQRIIDKNRASTITGFNFDIQSGEHSKGFMRLCAGEGCYMAKKAVMKDTWVHIAVVYSSEHPSVFENHVDFYINGVLDHSETVFAPTKQETWYPLMFGKPANVQESSNMFHGSMDNVAMFERELSEHEIRRYMYSLPVGDEEGLVGFWSFDDVGSDSATTHELSTNEFDGEVIGPTRELSIEKPLHLGRCQ